MTSSTISGVWVCKSNGNFENGDLITSSDHLGYEEKQDNEFITNCSVGKIIIDCSFELDNQYYNCYEIDELDINGNN
jgi:hypothetical protein